ncbi:MAG: LPS assembly protein LptD [Rubrivivax sp.]|nr:LPS assembly protein LptD [Rubrivivax sp.]
MRITWLALAAATGCGSGAANSQMAVPPLAASAAAAASAPLTTLQPSLRLQPLPRAEAARQLPIVLQAQSIRSQPDLQTVAEGNVEFRRGGVVIRADRLAYDTPRDRATASGQVHVSQGGAEYRGSQLEIAVQRFEGFFLEPQFEFPALGAGGRAERIDFLGNARSRATNASYTSCPRDDSSGAEPAWVLRTDSVRIDLDANEGVAEGAVLRFLGMPIVALPTLSFPLGDTRKSGWLPLSVNIDNRSGLTLSVPWYWNIAPNRDATLAPRLITRRGVALDSELRYLEARDEGSLRLDWLPYDQAVGRSRQSLQWQHGGHLGTPESGLRYSASIARVSDDDWWKDFPDASRGFTPRLLPLRLALEQPFALPQGEGLAYARALKWQVQQNSESFVNAPYERSPQVGVRLGGRAPGGLELTAETEFNRLTLPHNQAASTQRSTGERWHLLGSVSRPLRGLGWWVVPRLSVNTASYSGTTLASSASTTPAVPLASRGAVPRASRTIPTLSVDAGFELERSTQAFSRELHQTLEPRLLYVNTPYRAQSQLPNYDAAAKDFNFVSLYSDNTFSGIDRVSDSHQITAGFTTRLVDVQTGAEALRLGLVQRYLLRTQRITAQADGTPDGVPLERRFSDALLIGSTSVLPGWTFDGAVQYSPEIDRSVRSIIGVRYSPGPYRTLGTTYRLARGLSEQLEVGWQWPVWATAPGAGRSSAGSGCSGAWYSVGRFNYSLKDRRLTDSILGLEYDAGCWIGRVVAEQLSTGRSQATTRLLVQLELVGLSRIGSNPLKVLKDNIPGYRLLRDERGSSPMPTDDRPTGTPAP